MGDSLDSVLPPNIRNVKAKKNMTDEERLELAKKLDDDLDNFISGLEKRRGQDAWPEDRWEEEMEKHPFFMSKPPAEGEDLPPLLQGLQDLKYDASDNSPEELAETYKDDGNFYFRNKNYRMSIISYTEGIRRKCKDIELNAKLYNNRAASHFCLKNYRSCYHDCKKAIELKPSYPKVELRLAQCCLELKLFDDCIKICDELHSKYPSMRTNIKAVRDVADNEIRMKKRQKRKEAIKKLHEDLENSRIEKAIRERGIKFLDGDENLTADSPILDSKVHLDDQNRLVWPVVLMYPEYKTSDFIKEFPEDVTFMAQLEEVFAEPAGWDEERKYNVDSIRLYFEDVDGNIHSVSKTDTLGTILSYKSYRVDKGTPVFLVFAKDSLAEKNFLQCLK